MNTVVVTGAAGYIGGQISLQLKDAGHRVVGIDRREYPRHLAGTFDRFVHNDFASEPGLNALIQERPTAIIHCAGTSLVGPSILNPEVYFDNNVVKTLKMLDIVRQAIPKTRVIFSSSAAVYGIPVMTPSHEVDPRDPISPYGQSKLMVEMFLESYRVAYNLDYVAFRYFNACGADSLGRHGQESGATHIIARVLESMRDSQPFTLNGTDYVTDDGTCVRDYVHVEDIARAHILALDPKITAGVYNLATAKGTSNSEIIAAARAVVNRPLEVIVGPRRVGDPDELVASADKFQSAAGEWQRWGLNDMIRHAWNWYVR